MEKEHRDRKRILEWGFLGLLVFGALLWVVAILIQLYRLVCVAYTDPDYSVQFVRETFDIIAVLLMIVFGGIIGMIIDARNKLKEVKVLADKTLNDLRKEIIDDNDNHKQQIYSRLRNAINHLLNLYTIARVPGEMANDPQSNEKIDKVLESLKEQSEEIEIEIKRMAIIQHNEGELFGAVSYFVGHPEKIDEEIKKKLREFSAGHYVPDNIRNLAQTALEKLYKPKSKKRTRKTGPEKNEKV